MAIEIVDFPVKNGDFPVRYVSLPEGTTRSHIASNDEASISLSWTQVMPKSFPHPLGFLSFQAGCSRKERDSIW